MVTARYLTKKLIEPLERKEREERAEREAFERRMKELEAEEREKALAQARAEGFAEGRARERSAWMEWNALRLTFIANGIPFYGPPPPPDR